MNKNSLRETIRKIVKKKLDEELSAPLTPNQANDTTKSPTKNTDTNKPNPRLAALEKKQKELTGIIEKAKGKLADIERANMSARQRAERMRVNAERKLGIVNTQIQREKGKMEETKLKLKTLIEKILNEIK